jgi:hypothetical protein
MIMFIEKVVIEGLWPKVIYLHLFRIAEAELYQKSEKAETRKAD